MRLFIFFFFAILIFAAMLFIDSPKEGKLPLIAYSCTIGAIVSLMILDRCLRPEIYKKKIRWFQKPLFDKKKPLTRWQSIVDAISRS